MPSPDPLRRMAAGVPAGYVAFVGRHLAPLRQAAARVVGDEDDADRLYPDVLTDVAVWWVWLELSGTLWRDRRRAERRLWRDRRRAERRLWRAFAHRADRWNAALDADRAPGARPPGARPGGRATDAGPARADLDIRVWGPDGPPPARPVPGPTVRSSAALRLAPRLRPPPRPESSVVAEAAVAWCHAFAWWRRLRRIAVAVLACVALAFLLRLRQTGG